MAHKHKKSKNFSKNITYAVIAAVVVVVIVVIVMMRGNNAGNTGAKGDVVKVELYVMSQCPYGVQAEDLIAPVLNDLGSSVDFELNFIAGDGGNGQFSSLHGQNEVLGDIVQLCAMKYAPDKYMDFILCMNDDAGSIPNNWQQCSESLKLDTSSIKKCYEGDEGKQLLSQSIVKSNIANAQASPTILINGEEYSGPRDSQSLKRAVCKYSTSSLCEGIPACSYDFDCPTKEGKIPVCKNPNSQNAVCEYKDDAKVELTVVNDKRCSNCDTTQIVDALNNIFLNLDVKDVDASSDEGKQIVEQMGIQVVPSFVFDSNLVNTYMWQNNEQLRTIFEQKSGKYKLLDEATGANFYIDENARQEFLRSIGVTLGDNKPQIDFFVMSYCPYGNQAEELIDQVYNELGDKAQFDPHYVIYSNYGDESYCLDSTQEYCSMHGKQELHQDIREMCVDKYMGIDKWFEFATAMNTKCSYQNADSCWTDVAKSLGLDTQKISDCENNEAVELLSHEKELNDALKVTGSPQIFIDGAAYSGARDANSIMAAMCAAFDSTKPSECSNIIATSEDSTAAPAGGCGT
ncbi:hypothetical protein KY308_04225 [Candidatus Woesearchaeota archaeon]|nr:hypothetical protein [Candidatus Woesearchaeota archaeon]